MKYLIRSLQMIRGRGSYNVAHFVPADEARDTLLVRSWQAGAHSQKTIIQTGYNAMRKSDLEAEFTAIVNKQTAAGYKPEKAIAESISLGKVIEFKHGWEWWFNLNDAEQQGKFLKYLATNEYAELDDYSPVVLQLIQDASEKPVRSQPVFQSAPEPEVQPIEEPTVMVGFGAWA